MMKRLTVIFVFLLTAGTIFSQAPVRTCLTMEVDSILRANHPGMESMGDFENWMQRTLEKNAQSSSQQRQAVRTIPTVVHVIYSNSTENISTAQVVSQIEVLNEDFRRLNADTVNTPSGFQPAAADCNIEFCLAQTDPNGNPTDGINRVALSGSPFSTSYINGTIKPNTIWNPNDYFNIWVCNISGSILGYAQFPNSSGLSGLNANNGVANTDGVVLLHTSVGRPPANPFSGPYNAGRTATHEVGHWLGLKHIWGDGNCSVDDFCNDTPNSDNPNYGCPTTHVSCNTTDMVQNYMDYTTDACMNIFTADQKSRMDVVLANSPRRGSLLVSGKCNTPLGIAAGFTGNNLTGCAPLTVTFTDASTGPVTGWSWNFGGAGTSTQQNPTVTFSSPGTYTITQIVTDGTNFDTLTRVDYITVLGPGAGQTLPFTEDFEGTFPPANWQLENPDNSDTWVQATVGGITPGTKAAKMSYFSYNAPGQRDGLITPQLDLSNYSSASMDFDHAYRRYSNNGTDSLIIYVSTSCGGSWTRVVGWGENGTRSFATSNRTTTNWTPSQASHWCFAGNHATCYTVDLTPYVGNSYVKVKFEGYNGYQNNLFLDNINITGVVSQQMPVADFSAGSSSICEGSSVTFTDNTTNSPNAWSWNFGDGGTSTQQNPSHTYTSPGSYSVTLISTNPAGSDTIVKPNIVVVNANPTLISNGNDATCGNNNGNATVAASGGGGGFTYSWSNGGTTASISGLSPGTYTVTVTDANTCTSTASVSVASIPAPTLSANANATTCGLNNGSATSSLTGGTAPFTYLWSNGGTTASISNLPSGTYSVTVTDSLGCTDVSSATVAGSTNPSALMSGQNTSCGLNNGTATANVTGGTGNISYSWSNGGTTQTVIGLAAGTYTVTVTDAAGCTDTAPITIASSQSPSVSASATATSCGQNNGSATATGSGGAGSYSYSWSNGGTTASISNLQAGSYTVTLMDGAGCFTTTSVTVASSSGPSISIQPTATSCGQNNGAATANVTGGNGSISYAWSNGGTSASISGLTAGSYTVTVTDGAGCVSTRSVNIDSSSAPSVSVSRQNTSCGFNNGVAVANASGGSGGYTYNWSNGGTSAVITGLSAGSYTVTITDGAGCTSTATTNISGSSSIATNPNPVNASCGLNNGSITLSPTNGTGGYSYNWSNGGTTAAITGLSPGNYFVTVADGGNCSTVDTISISGSPAVSVSATGSATTCGQNNGSASATGSGGSGQLVYSWSNGGNTANISNLAPGTYTVTVTDGVGCTDVSTVSVGSSTGITASVSSSQDEACGQANGVANATATGTGPFSYSWSNGQTGAQAIGLSAGTYTVTVTDAAGCPATASVTIAAIAGPSLSVSSATDVSCAGAGDGSATVTASGGTGIVTYSWSNGQTTPTASGLAGGTYSVTVTDANGCADSLSVTVTEPAVLAGTVSGTDETAPGANDGAATATGSGGTSPYAYNWSNGGTTASISGLSGGTYTVTITDANGCEYIDSVTISTLTSLSEVRNPVQLEVFPNPNEGKFNIRYKVPTAGAVQLRIYDARGKLVRSETGRGGAQHIISVDLGSTAKGIYYVELSAGDYRGTVRVSVQ